MDITLIVKDNCAACVRVERVLRKLVDGQEDIILSVLNINDAGNLKTQICPALFVNKELYSYGDIEADKFAAHLKKQIEKGACKNAVYKSN
jgi:hypothetical protein